VYDEPKRYFVTNDMSGMVAFSGTHSALPPESTTQQLGGYVITGGTENLVDYIKGLRVMFVVGCSIWCRSTGGYAADSAGITKVLEVYVDCGFFGLFRGTGMGRGGCQAIERLRPERILAETKTTDAIEDSLAEFL
jgi:hypothetical protein